MKRNPRERDEQPGCTVRLAATSRNWQRDKSLSLEAEKATMTMHDILIGPYGLHAFLGAALALFVGFLYVFNFTTFF
jgi:hypothetical protein